MDPQQKAVADEFDQYQKNYSDAVNKALSFSGLKVDYFTRVKADYLLEQLTLAFGATDQLAVLDVGCGVGNYHPLIVDKVAALHGVDVSAACVAQGEKANPRVRYAAYDGTRLPYPDAHFDAAVTICVLHHVPTSQWSSFTTEMARVLKPGGLALVFEHNPRNPLTMRVVNRCPFDRDAVLLKSDETRGLLQSAGLEDVKTRHILTVPAGTRRLRQVDQMFSGLRIGAQYFVSGRKPIAATSPVRL
jgi:ubiquinone/menaquinone biosynthesis C-methylase UbiE